MSYIIKILVNLVCLNVYLFLSFFTKKKKILNHFKLKRSLSSTYNVFKNANNNAHIKL